MTFKILLHSFEDGIFHIAHTGDIYHIKDKLRSRYIRGQEREDLGRSMKDEFAHNVYNVNLHME